MNKQENERINKELRELYLKHTAEHRHTWKKCYGEEPPKRINEFGVIDVKRYDVKNGILVIGRETNGVKGWFERNLDEDLFINWLNKISINEGELPSHPSIWYNTARYIMTVQGNKKDALEFENKKLLPALGTVAFTNINKVGGGSNSGKAYWKMYKKSGVIRLIVEEIEIIKPRYIILCDKYFAKFLTEENLAKLNIENYSALKECIDNNRLYAVPHPAARMSKEKMLNELEKQIRGE